jgi:amidase
MGKLWISKETGGSEAMRADEYVRHDAIGLADLIRAGQVTVSEVLAAAQARLVARKDLNAVVLDLCDRASAQITGGLGRGPLAGVPFMLKDLGQHYAGTVTSSGSRAFAGYTADHDSTLTQRYLAAGLVICGKTNTPELGLATTTEPRLHGATRNPHQAQYSTGGSSGGAAAAVAGGIVPVAHASDGGGSIRIPASCCGLFGLKPTRGRTPLGPDELEGWGGLSTAHVISRSVRDSALILDLTHGPETGSPYTAPPASRSYQLEIERPVRKLVIAVSSTSFTGVTVLPEIDNALQVLAERCRSLGHEVRESPLEVDSATHKGAHGVLAISHVAATLTRRAAVLGRALHEEDVERVTWQNYQAARGITGADYAMAQNAVQQLGLRVGRFFNDCDLLLTPTMAMLPPRLGAMDMMGPENERYLDILYRMIAFTALFNDTGNPAISVPVAMSEAGLPIGMQFVGPHGSEGLLLQVARQLEREGIAQARIAA